MDKSLILNEIKKHYSFKSDTKFAEFLGISPQLISNWKTRNTYDAKLLYTKCLDLSPEWLLTGKGEMLKSNLAPINEVNEPAEKYKLEAVLGVPYYDVEFTSSFLEVENNQTIQPTSYISHPFFTGCDLVVRNSGQSMAKLICHGDAVGLVKINNWQEFFPLGEVYGIVTENNFRMIKIITKGNDDQHYTLISKPTDSKKDEFPTQQIKKTSIVAIFKVQACSHLF